MLDYWGFQRSFAPRAEAVPSVPPRQRGLRPRPRPLSASPTAGRSSPPPPPPFATGTPADTASALLLHYFSAYRRRAARPGRVPLLCPRGGPRPRDPVAPVEGRRPDRTGGWRGPARRRPPTPLHRGGCRPSPWRTAVRRIPLHCARRLLSIVPASPLSWRVHSRVPSARGLNSGHGYRRSADRSLTAGPGHTRPTTGGAGWRDPPSRRCRRPGPYRWCRVDVLEAVELSIRLMGVAWRRSGSGAAGSESGRGNMGRSVLRAGYPGSSRQRRARSEVGEQLIDRTVAGTRTGAGSHS